MPTTRNPRAGIDDRWHRSVKQPDGSMRKERSAVYGKVSRWRVRWVDDTGQEHTKVFRLKESAQSHLDQVTADIVKGTTYINPRSSAVTFGEVANEWIEAKQARKPKTVAGYVSLLDNLVLPKWRDVKLADISHADVQRWVSELSRNGSVRTEGKGLSGSRVRQAHQVLGAVLKYAIKTERLVKNVATGAQLPRKKGAKEHVYLTHEQVWSLADAVRDVATDAGLKPQTYVSLTLVLAYCGLRVGEARSLRWRDLNDKTITVRASTTKVDGMGYVEDTTKTHRTRWVPVPEPVWKRLAGTFVSSPDHMTAVLGTLHRDIVIEHTKSRGSWAERDDIDRRYERARGWLDEFAADFFATRDLVTAALEYESANNPDGDFGPAWEALRVLSELRVFPGKHGGVLTDADYRAVFDKAVAKIGISGLTPHGLRHTTASLAVSAGANVKAVQRLLGHASAVMTLDEYADLFDDDLVAVADALDNAMRDHCGTTAVPEPSRGPTK